jgi:hypothetical protein
MFYKAVATPVFDTGIQGSYMLTRKIKDYNRQKCIYLFREWKIATRRFLNAGLVHDIEKMWEDLECDGQINSDSNGDGKGQWAILLKLVMMTRNENNAVLAANVYRLDHKYWEVHTVMGDIPL